MESLAVDVVHLSSRTTSVQKLKWREMKTYLCGDSCDTIYKYSINNQHILSDPIVLYSCIRSKTMETPLRYIVRYVFIHLDRMVVEAESKPMFNFRRSISATTKWVFPKIGIPQNGWFIMENPIKIGWFGGTTVFRKHPNQSSFSIFLDDLWCFFHTPQTSTPDSSVNVQVLPLQTA